MPLDVGEFTERYKAAWNACDTSAIAELITDDIVWDDPAMAQPARSVAEVQEFMRVSFRAFPDLLFGEPDPPAIAVAGDVIFWAWNMQGTHRGPLLRRRDRSDQSLERRQTQHAGPMLERVQGSLDMMILKTLMNGTMHGWGVAHHIRTRSHDALTVKQGALYQADMGFGFHPHRRDVAWHDAEPVPLAVLQDELAFTQEKNWGYRLRQGLIEISDADMTLIAEAMFTAEAEPRRLAA